MFIDSNVLCYYMDSTTKEHKNVRVFFEELPSQEELHINAVVLLEVCHYLMRRLGAEKGKQIFQELMTLPLIVHDTTREIVLCSSEEMATHFHTGIGARDASILSTMQLQRIPKLLTHDKAFKKISSITVLDPTS